MVVSRFYIFIFLVALKALCGESAEIFDKSIAELRRSKSMKTVLRSGKRAPDFKLLDQSGSTVNLNKLLEQGPVVIVFYRGSWCHYCNLALLSLSEISSQIDDLGVKLVAITPEIGDGIHKIAAKVSPSFFILSDPDGKVASNYGLNFRVPDQVNEIYSQMGISLSKANRNSKQRLPIPATYIVDQTGLIKFDFVDADYKVRVDKQELLQSLQNLVHATESISKRAKLQIAGMSCGSCSKAITSRLSAKDGVVSVEVSHETGLAHIEYINTKITLQQLVDSVGRGFKVITAENY